MLTVQEVRSLPDLLRYEEEWDALLQAAPNGSFFLSPQWLTSWIEVFWSKRAIRFLLMREDGRLVGLAPFVEDGRGDLGCRLSLAFPVNQHSHACDVLIGGGASALAGPLLSHLDPQRAGFRVRLGHLDCASPFARSLPEVAGDLGLVTQEHKRTEWAFARLGSSWAEYLQGRDPHVRSEVRRKRRRIGEAGEVRVRCYSTPEECRVAFEDVLHVESRSWKEEGSTSLPAERGASAFYRALTYCCALEGSARIYVLYLDGRPIAHLLGVEFRQAYLALKTSYDRRYRGFSPGQVLVLHALEDSLGRGLQVFDFLGEVSRWKRELATDTRTWADVCLFSRKNLACRACRFGEGRIKPLARRWLPVAARPLRAARRMLTGRKA